MVVESYFWYFVITFVFERLFSGKLLKTERWLVELEKYAYVIFLIWKQKQFFYALIQYEVTVKLEEEIKCTFSDDFI